MSKVDWSSAPHWASHAIQKGLEQYWYSEIEETFAPFVNPFHVNKVKANDVFIILEKRPEEKVHNLLDKDYQRSISAEYNAGYEAGRTSMMKQNIICLMLVGIIVAICG